MKYLTGYYYVSNPITGFTLQVATRVMDEIPIVLAAVWERESGGGRNQMPNPAEWFEERVLSACRKGKAEKGLEKVLRSLKSDVKGMTEGSFVVFLCVGEECLYGWQGNAEIHLFNMCFGRLHRKKLTYLTEDFHMERARMDKNVGLVLGNADFFAGAQEAYLKECLATQGLSTDMQVQRHLRELGEAASKVTGGKYAEVERCPTAVMLVSKGIDET